MKLDAVIFDMDGVIYDSEKMYFAADQLAAQKLGMKDFTLDYYKQFLGSGYDVMYAKMVKDYGDLALIKKFLALAREEIILLVKEGKLQFKPGVFALTDYLTDNHITYGLASSNYRQDIDFYLKETHFENRFDFIVSGDDVQKSKPAPDVFLKAWEDAGKPDKKKTIVIEDATNGVIAANRAGIPVIMVPDYTKPGNFEEEHTLTIQPNLNKVLEFLKN